MLLVKILKFHQCIFAISLLSPLGKGQDPSFEKTWIHFIQNALTAPILIEIIPLVLEKKNFKFVNVFQLFVVISPWRKASCFIWMNLHSFLPKMLCAKFSWNCSLNFINVCWLFPYHLLFEKDRVLHLNKFESPSPKNALYQVWFKLVRWFKVKSLQR